jgi:hypothetical protein
MSVQDNSAPGNLGTKDVLVEEQAEDAGAHVLLEGTSFVVGGEDQADPTVELQMINGWPYIYGVKVPLAKSTK